MAVIGLARIVPAFGSDAAMTTRTRDADTCRWIEAGLANVLQPNRVDLRRFNATPFLSRG
jgi:hypothetical protein